MTQVKKYRAASTREALEMIKQDLGEDAFVLETKRVKAGGFLGFRSTTKVEVSAAAPAAMSRSVETGDRKKKKTRGAAAQSILDLNEDTGTYRRPTSAARVDATRDSLMSVLTSRAASAEGLRPDENGSARPIETVEISSEAPKIVFPRKTTAAKPKETAEPAAEPTPPVMSQSRELEMLRAELREVKFSLGAFAGLQAGQAWHSDIDLNIFGDTFESPFHETYIELVGAGIPAELARKFVTEIVPLQKATPVAAGHLTRATLLRSLSASLRFEESVLSSREGRTIMAMIGPTGVGKTTSIAKLAARLSLHERRRVELITLDTYRIAAVEQLKTYAEIIGVGCHVVGSVLELDSVLKRLSPDAAVLIDTTGRSPHDLSDQHELSDYLQKNLAIRKCLAIQATTNTVDNLAAIGKFQMYGADCLALTKIDETLRPGAVLESLIRGGLPLAYVSTGQRVPEDLQVATAAGLTDRVLGITKRNS